MELTLALALTIVNCTIGVVSFVLNRKDKAVKDTKEQGKENHQELIEYQLNELKESYKSMAVDIKDIKKMLDNYRETFRTMIKDEITEHVKIYHSKEK